MGVDGEELGGVDMAELSLQREARFGRGESQVPRARARARGMRPVMAPRDEGRIL